jgi:hypothetical protein
MSITKEPTMPCYFVDGLKCNDDCRDCDVIENYLGFAPKTKRDIEIAIAKRMNDDMRKAVFGD